MKPNKEFYKDADGKPNKTSRHPIQQDTLEDNEPSRRLFLYMVRGRELKELMFVRDHPWKPEVWSAWQYTNLNEVNRPFYINNKDITESNGYFKTKTKAQEHLSKLNKTQKPQ